MTEEPDGRLALARGVWLDPSDVQWRFSTAGGPGGQHVNTSNTRAEAVLDLAAARGLPDPVRERLIARLGPVVAVSAADSRSQTRNRELALRRLAGRLASALVDEKPRRPTRPTAGSKARRLEAKRRRASLKRSRRGEGGGDAD